MNQQLIVDIKKALKHFNAGNMAKAEKLASRVLGKDPGNTDVMNLIAVVALRKGNYKRVIELLRKAISINPQNPMYYYNLGLGYSRSGEFAQAAKQFRQAVKLKPDFAEAYSDLCNVAKELYIIDEAVEAGLTAVRLAPDSYAAHTNLALAYEEWGNAPLALEHHIKAAKLEPNNARVQHNLGNAYVINGDKAAAKKCFMEAVRLQPTYTEPLRQLARFHKYTSTDHEDFARFEKLTQDEAIAEGDRSHLHFALGKMYEDCSMYDQAFDHYATGNQIEDKKFNFDPETFNAYVSKQIDVFTPDFIESHRKLGNSSTIPVFIVGMPRSGTSLVEQILSSHPQAFGAGELSWFWAMESILPKFLKTKETYPECVLSIDDNAIQALTSKYLNYLQILSEGNKYTRIVDKMPANANRLGLIALFFPNAKIIHCRRNAMDTCLSIYSRIFPGKLHYSYDLHKLGNYYAEYERLMKHWHAVMPGRIFDIQYEDLVQNQEAVTRRLIEFVGLPWDDQCLSFYKNKRAVRTASDFQVRQPIYTDSIDRWKLYEKHLGPLQEALDL